MLTYALHENNPIKVLVISYSKQETKIIIIETKEMAWSRYLKSKMNWKVIDCEKKRLMSLIGK